jgi:hypothetical protein
MEGPRWGFLIPVALVTAMVYENVRWIEKPGEGWEAAASQLKEAPCTMFVPAGSRTIYAFFEPQLQACDENSLTTAGTVALALSLDQTASASAGAREKLQQAGFRKVADLRTSEPRIELYGRSDR